MAQELTQEQIEKAHDAWLDVIGWAPPALSDTGRKAIIAIAEHVQYAPAAPPQYAEDVVEGMCEAWKMSDPVGEYSLKQKMSAALESVLDRLERQAQGFNGGAVVFAASFRASLLKPVEMTLEEEIDICIGKFMTSSKPWSHVEMSSAIKEIVNRRSRGSHE